MSRCLTLNQQQQQPSRPVKSQIYPAYTFSHSPTFSKWVKLTCADISGLRHLAQYGGHTPPIYFHLNHPIRYVYLAGMVVATEAVGDGRWHILTLDDGSGVNTEIKIERIREKSVDRRRDGFMTNLAGDSHDSGDDSSGGSEPSEDEAPENSAALHRAGLRTDEPRRSLLVPVVSLTTTPDVTVRGYDVWIDNTIIDTGTVVKVKGTLLPWRKSLQIKLEKLTVVTTSDEEARIWEEYSDFVIGTLAQPWHLTQEQLAMIKAEDESRRLQEAQAKQMKLKSKQALNEKRKVYDAKKKAYEEKLERRLLKEAKKLDGNPLV